jgi:hypothetical protein
MAPHRQRFPLLIALAGVAMLHTSGLAWADDPRQAPPAASPYQVQPAQPPLYVAPLSQETQTTYVPQSVALSGPEEIDADDDTRPAPAGYTPVFRKRRHMIVGGAVTLGVTYGVSALTAAIGEDASRGGTNEVAALWIPVAGPFIQILQTDSATAKVFLVGLGGAQLAGAIMLYTGMTSPQRVFVRNDLVGSLTVTPMAGNGTSGLALSGRF